MKSMTGYGHGEIASKGGISFKVEIKAVNRKQFDLKLYLPQELNEYESQIRKTIADSISRGSVNVSITLALSEESLKKSIKINQEILKAYIESADSLAKELGLSQNLTIADLYKLPKSVEMVNPEFSSDEKYIEDLFQAIRLALTEFNKSRRNEGEFLKNHFSEKLALLASTLSKIEGLAVELPKIYHAKLLDRIRKNQEVTIPNEELFIKEIVMISDRCDATEEITRLKSHFSQFEKLIKEETPGRNLDFLTQEIQREINTLGVKAATSEISPLVVAFKTEVEKIREQIQNIE
ncbi:MAG: YicC/YloC family endoribonuclease [Lentisphaerota bacterium]